MSKEKKEIVRLDTVKIEGLFNTFNYRFNYSNPEHVSIVMAPNGCGKTTIFKFISFLLEPDVKKLHTILTIPFKSFTCTFSDGRSVGIRTEDKGTSEGYDFFADTIKVTKFCDFVYWEKGKKSEFSFFKKMQEIEAANPNDDEFLYDDKNDSEKAKGFSEDFINRIAKKTEYEWDEYINNPINPTARNLSQMIYKLNSFKLKYPCVRFIESNRTEKLIDVSERRRSYENVNNVNDDKVIDPISKIQHRINMIVASLMHRYTLRMDKAKNNLPQRYLENKIAKYKSKEKFLEDWNRYIADVEKYSHLGLFSSEQISIGIDDIEKVYDGEKGTFLKIYLSEYQEAINSLHDEMLNKLELFLDILNRRNDLTDKVLKIGSQYRLIVECRGKEIPLTALSSGEKNDFIMFYRLIFETKPESIILVDEPEISLHIEWQEEYLNQLLEICKMNDCQAIVATHSPNIINTHVALFAKREVSYEEF